MTKERERGAVEQSCRFRGRITRGGRGFETTRKKAEELFYFSNGVRSTVKLKYYMHSYNKKTRPLWQ